MRIISNFKDYYDCGAAFGIDPKVVFTRLKNENSLITVGSIKGLREPSEGVGRYSWYDLFRLDENTVPEAYKSNVRGCGGIREGWLLLCGKQYPFYYVSLPPPLNGLGMENWRLTSFSPKWKQHMKYCTGSEEFLERQSQGWEHSFNKESDSPLAIITKKTYREWEVERVPCLKEWNVNGLFDPYFVFNEIAMWIGKQQAEGKEKSLPLTDKQKVEQHGLDPKHGFRRN